MAYPKLIVFDLDYTLWPFWCDTHVTPPIKAKKGHNAVVDKYGDQFSFYPEVEQILKHCQSLEGVHVAIASRTHAPRVARDLLRLLEFDGQPSHKFLEYTAWGTSSKIGHLSELKTTTKIPFEEMILFDDEDRNQDVETKGATFKIVRKGMTMKVFNDGIELWRKKNRR